MIPTLNIHQGAFLKFSSWLPGCVCQSSRTTHTGEILATLTCERMTRGHPSLSGAWGVSTVGVRRDPRDSTWRRLLFAFPPCFAVLRCDRGWWRACAGLPHWGCDQGTCTQCLQYHVEKTFLFSSQLENSLSSCYTKWFTVLYFFFFYIMSNKKYSCNILIPVNFVL